MTKQSDRKTEIAKRALDAGLQPHEALEKIYPFEYEDLYEESPAEALQLFASSLCGHKTSDLILEYTSLPFFAHSANRRGGCGSSAISRCSR